MIISKTKQGRSVTGRGLPTVTSCLLRSARPSLSCRGHIEAQSIKVWTSPKRDQGTSELDTEQVWIPEVTHLMQGAQQVVRIQVPGPRKQVLQLQ